MISTGLHVNVGTICRDFLDRILRCVVATSRVTGGIMLFWRNRTRLNVSHSSSSRSSSESEQTKFYVDTSHLLADSKAAE